MTNAFRFSTILSNDQVLKLLALYDEGVTPAEAVRRSGIKANYVTRWYKKFWSGWAPTHTGLSPTQEGCFTGPVPKRPVPPPNAMPWATPARLMARRA